MQQITLAEPVSFKGIGLHSGREVTMSIKPAPVDTGIVFVRTDLEGCPGIRATADNVTSTLRATTLEEHGAKVFTVEHVMSALNAYDVDNCFVEMDGEEPPVAGGSAETFFSMLKKAGQREQDAPRIELVVDKVYRVDDDEHKRFIMAVPYDGLRISFTSVNPHPLIGIQYGAFVVSHEVYEKEIAPARTIAYEKEVQALREMGLGLGGTMENVIVYNDEGWLNQLIFKDELVRHKILDVIGDLRLAGIVRGHIIASASGHSLNTALAKKLLASAQTL
ncbi:MAG: UDP-3-O-acyl-N-acetylglucosamine deacetylase [Butyrivibrio sp.]|nr:UDP-3-O-acyl-N-acetylglucosamine deacetylase [Butyrivibrio sp.]